MTQREMAANQIITINYSDGSQYVGKTDGYFNRKGHGRMTFRC